MNTATRVPIVIARAYGTIGGFLRPWLRRGIPKIIRNAFASVVSSMPFHAIIATAMSPPAMQVSQTTLSAIGQPLKNVAFRMPEVTRLLGVEEDHILTEEDAARILSSSFGSRKAVGDRKFCVILNQCDDGPRRRSANLIAQYLARFDVENVVMTAFDPDERKNFNALAGVR